MVDILEIDLGPDVAAVRLTLPDGTEKIIINPEAVPGWLDERSDASGG